MTRNSKRIREIAKQVEAHKACGLEEAIDFLQKCPPVKFDQTVDISIKLGVDAKKSDQQVRGTVSLPNGTGITRSVLVFAAGDKMEEALKAGADFAGSTDLFEKVKGGWTHFDVVVATPDMMREVGKLGRVLGPRGLMPTPKAGTVTTDVATAVEEIKKGKIEFRLDRHGVCNNGVGKLSFSKEALVENINALLHAIVRAKPATSKGQYVLNVALSSTMGPGVKIDLHEIPTA
ncbi:MAG: 50S ribosomal protein L1 [Chlamydiae bacterium]|nr:50S ribosomal protein L1 [Chlamydiota bacterium]